MSETIYETYTRTICVNCKNKDTDLCNIRKDMTGVLRCSNYQKDKNIEGYKKFKGITAKQNKPIMGKLL